MPEPITPVHLKCTGMLAGQHVDAERRAEHQRDAGQADREAQVGAVVAIV